jgi:uncharacterized protein with PQ loop repeat
MNELLGWLGAFLLAFCGLPQAIDSFKNKSSYGVTWGLLLMWGSGEIFALLYVLPTMQWPLLFNYSANLLFLSVIIYYKIWPNFNKRS